MALSRNIIKTATNVFFVWVQIWNSLEQFMKIQISRPTSVHHIFSIWLKSTNNTCTSPSERCITNTIHKLVCTSSRPTWKLLPDISDKRKRKKGEKKVSAWKASHKIAWKLLLSASACLEIKNSYPKICCFYLNNATQKILGELQSPSTTPYPPPPPTYIYTYADNHITFNSMIMPVAFKSQKLGFRG